MLARSILPLAIILAIGAVTPSMGGSRLPSSADTQNSKLPPFTWPTLDSDGRPSAIVSKESIAQFLNARLYDHSDIDPSSVCAVSFVKTASNDQYRMLVSIDPSGRQLCNELVVSDKDGWPQVLPAWLLTSEQSLANLAVRPPQGKSAVLVVPSVWFAVSGLSNCVATWPTVYIFLGRHLVDVSTAHPEVYRSLLAGINAKRAAPEAGDEASGACLIMESDRIKRRLGLLQDAGLETAERWSRSNNSKLKREAAAVFTDIGTDRALADLYSLVADPNKSVSDQAKLFIMWLHSVPRH